MIYSKGMITPTLREEKRLIKKGYRLIAGIDEAGRGPIAGPVIAAVVATKPIREIRLPRKKSLISFRGGKFEKIREVRDSKLLTPKKREELYKLITRSDFFNWAVGTVSEKVIDKINILQASRLAMTKAVEKLRQRPDFLLIDGKWMLENRPYGQKAIPSGDKKVFLIACASIIAKVTRDRLMLRLHKKYPQYGFEQHKGYGTKLHFKTLKKHGPCKIHRKTFWPIKLQD